ncbi:MAG: GTP cyclohydrolase I FolE [Myxococcota bacterium]|nr:GTP cyclohydrolase I FolE [Myxococcota bacterium]
MNRQRVARLIKELLAELGEDPGREGLRDTPRRTAAAWEFLTQGYRTRAADAVRRAVFAQEANNMVVVRDIEVYSLCEHHLLPFFGRCHVGYIPKDKVLGVSKVARVVDVFARRLQVQERLTQQIARALMDSIKAEGVGVVVEAQHLCMMMRGVQKQNSLMTTSSVLGSFHDDAATRAEFMALVTKPRPA